MGRAVLTPEAKAHKRKARIIADERKLEQLQTRLRTLGERSTFHGVDVLLEAKPGWPRRLVILILLGMCVACFYTVSDLVAGFINMPISTVINYGQEGFQFPTVVVCPDSPFSIERVLAYPDLAKAYHDVTNYWITRADEHSTPNPMIWTPADGYWRQRAKRSFRGFYMANRSRLMWHWSDFLVSCEYDGKPCGVGQQLIPMPTAVMSPESEVHVVPEGAAKLNWEAQGLVRPVSYSTEQLPSSWPDGPPNPESMNAEPPEWPQGKVIMVDHPSKYLCFQLKMNSTMVKEPGSTRGLHLLLRRPYNPNRTQPALLSVESRAQILQPWDDRLFLSRETSPQAKLDAKKAVKMDGFHVIVHEDTNLPRTGSLSADDVYKASSSRSVISVGVRFGQQVSVEISQFVHQRLSTVYRQCKKQIKTHKFLEVSSFISSGGFARRYVHLAYTQNNCVTQMRQLIMLRLCHCLSEDYMVPLQMASELVRYGFCHSGNSMISSDSPEFMERIKCHDKVSALTREQVLDRMIPKSWGKPILIKLTPEVERLWICPKFCRETISQAEIIQRHAIPTDLPANVSGLDQAIHRSDLAAITIYANGARVPVISEGEQMNIFNLLASIGGTFGLFLGLSGVTVFEVIEALFLVLRASPALCRICVRSIHGTNSESKVYKLTTNQAKVISQKE
ncbi:unnamed protein product [Echinostoma caproni]|uniref:Amiloride-sensitive sodium channel n=1 Tax=Echinostoma caproni TaxID=27848 RepID=A0A183A8M6_9TREM|nr:unnamed protein product [Echinostoma caproni]